MKVKLLIALISLLLIRFVGSSQTNGNPHPLSSPNSVLEVAPKPFIDGTTTVSYTHLTLPTILRV